MHYSQSQAALSASVVSVDLMSLRVGAAFWRQQKELSEKAWQAQRQVLHADYRAKHRAAAKHTHKANKPRHG